MDVVGRAQIVERLKLLDQASLDFPDQVFTLECHHLINDVAGLVPSTSEFLGELARATQAASQQRVRTVCAILRAVLAVSAQAMPDA